MRFKIYDFGPTIEGKLESVKSEINKKRTTSCSLDLQRESLVDADDEDGEKIAASTQFISTMKNKLYQLRNQFQRFDNTRPVFGFQQQQFYFELVKIVSIPSFS